MNLFVYPRYRISPYLSLHIEMQIHKNCEFVKEKVELIANKDKIAYQQTPHTDMVIKLSLKPKHN